MRILKTAVVLILGLLAVTTMPAASDADAFFQAKDWANAARAYEEVVAVNADDALAWYRLGLSRHQLEQYAQAATAYEKANALGSSQRGLKYNLACVYARVNRRTTPSVCSIRRWLPVSATRPLSRAILTSRSSAPTRATRISSRASSEPSDPA